MGKKIRFVSAEEAVGSIQSGDCIHLGSVSAVPKILIDALCARGRRRELRDVTFRHILTSPTADYCGPEFEGVFRADSFFIGDNVRKNVDLGLADYIPGSLYETPGLYRDGYLRCDAAMVQVSPPDEHGMVSLGTAVDATRAAVDCAGRVLAVINDRMPHTLGDALFPAERITYAVEGHAPLDTAHPPPPSEVETAIGRHCAGLIDDGDCLQLGIGAIPNAVLAELTGHRDLGIHSEMFSDGVLELVERGVINGSRKAIDRGKLVVTFLSGSEHLFRFVHKNPLVEMREASYTNDPFVIAANPHVASINSAIQVDITGQVCADSIGSRMYSGVGGQLDFVYGAFRSPGGKAIIAIASTTPKGASKIVPELTPGAGVTTPRHLLHYLVTEYGAVDLYGKSLQQRARSIIGIAHPDHREALEEAAGRRFGPHFRIKG